MDSRRPPFAAAAPPPPPQYHYQHPPPHTPVDHRPPPPPPFPPPHQHPPPTYGYPPPAGAPGSGQTLPPFQQLANPPPGPEQQRLPPFQQHPHEPPRDDYHSYGQHQRPEHATPAPVNRSFSHDSAHQQRTPTTPAHPGAYPPTSAPDGAPPPQQQMEHAQHHGYPPTNGVPHGLPPPHHDQGHHYIPPMETHHGYAPQHQQSMAYSPSAYGPASHLVTIQKRKQMRATQACEQCRQRKQKCDEGNPCSFCKENSLNCAYRDTPPAKTDKNMEKLLQYMESHQNLLGDLLHKVDSFDERLRRAEHAGGTQAVGDNRESRFAEEEEPPVRRRAELDDHRTAPHKLILLWPSVGPLLQHAGVKVDNSYVIQAEDRGILRLYTRGEGIDEYDGTQPGGPASPARSEDSGEVTAPSPPDGVWGTGLPTPNNGEIRRSDSYGWGGLKPDGSIDLDVTTINALYESYIKNMHVMHPFLDKSRLRKLIDSFIKKYATGHPNLRTKFAVDSGSDSERPLKRQRSSGPNGTAHHGNERRHEPTERSPGNCIVWLVLALGKICLHKDPLPGTVPDGRVNTNTVISHQLTGNYTLTSSSPVSGMPRHHPMSPTSTPTTTQQTPSSDPMRVDSRSRRASFDGLTNAGPRNVDVIPGLAYFCKAVEILGDQSDGNDLVHAQMFLLAGLYKGQLARVKESMSWFYQGGRAIIMLLDRYKLYNDNYWTAYGDTRKQFERGQARIRDKRHSLIVLASWSCLQLESDILAEIRMPNSGISEVENMLLMPHNMPDEEKESYEGIASAQQDANDRASYDNILLYYTAQTFLRKRLNQVHKELYGDECLKQSLFQVREMLSGHESILGKWREGLPEALRWADDDQPPSDILNARLQAKYWGARYVINRPFLDYALHIMPHVKDGMSIEQVAKDVHGNPRSKAEIHLFKAIELMGESEIWQASKRCIDAAMHSTIAFDGIEDRLIVTNIHGTAHAQFGNMLVLAATFYNNWLKQLVPEQRFRALLERTIGFLRKLVPISPTCYHDCHILEGISGVLFGPPADQMHIYRNEIEPSSASNSFGPST